jgi:hypothetical protein
MGTRRACAKTCLAGRATRSAAPMSTRACWSARLNDSISSTSSEVDRSGLRTPVRWSAFGSARSPMVPKDWNFECFRFLRASKRRSVPRSRVATSTTSPHGSRQPVGVRSRGGAQIMRSHCGGKRRRCIVGGGVVVLREQAHGLGCESPGGDARFDSTVGTSHFRWWPLGVECVYTRAANGVDRRDEPGPLPSAWVLVSVALSIAVARSFGATRTGGECRPRARRAVIRSP